LLAVWALASLIFIVPVQWCMPGLLYWSTVEQRFGETVSLAVLRAISSWRLAHTYGVFPPKLPSHLPHMAVAWEISTDGVSWRNLRFRSRHSHADDMPPLPLHSALRFSRIDFTSYYDGMRLFFEPATDLQPSPYLKSTFSHRHRIAWGLLTNAPALRAHFAVPDDIGPIVSVRASLVSLVPVTASLRLHSEIDTRGLGCERPNPFHSKEPRDHGPWSRVVMRCEHLPSTTLRELERHFGLQPHAALLPAPADFSSSNQGHAALSRDGLYSPHRPQHAPPSDEMSDTSGSPLAVIGYPTSAPMSCLVAPHLIPRSLHPSICVLVRLPLMMRGTSQPPNHGLVQSARSNPLSDLPWHVEL